MEGFDHQGYWHLPVVVCGASLSAWPVVCYALARAYRRMEARHRAAWATPDFRGPGEASYRRAAFPQHVSAPLLVRATAAFAFFLAFLCTPLATSIVAWTYFAAWGWRSVWAFYRSLEVFGHLLVLSWPFVVSPYLSIRSASLLARRHPEAAASARRVGCANVVGSLVAIAYAFGNGDAFKNDYWRWLEGETFYFSEGRGPARYFNETGVFLVWLAIAVLVAGVVQGIALLVTRRLTASRLAG